MDKELEDYADRAWRGDEPLFAYYKGELRKDGLRRIDDGVWMWAATGNVYVFETADGLVLFDTGDRNTATALHAAVRARSTAPVVTAVYSHGHIDHVLGLSPFEAEAAERHDPAISVVAHAAVPERFARYRLTAGYNATVNRRQFRAPGITWPTDYREPDRTYLDTLTLRHGDLTMELRHGRGETDDATMAWLPDRRILCCGDFYAWVAPNAGNPQKVRRHVAEWVRALRWMAGLGAEILLPGHGVPVVGADRVRETLLGSATLLSTLHDGVVAMMNEGCTLDEILHAPLVTPEVSALLAQPWLRPTYDDPQFIVRTVWRTYGGWYDGDPSTVGPAPRADLAAEVAQLAGGACRLAERALDAADRGRLDLAGHLAEWAALSAPEDRDVQRIRADVFGRLAAGTPALMAQGIYTWAQAEAQAKADDVDPWSTMRGGRWAP
ncbi:MULTISPECIES: alkyl sulfatase dimerization domain-containing protein [unclassified Micromonospora]|uniref:alkyl sulfatase dimerization domain-containing protein n=1 Tax=unclassified Micromonospora TaxID=2617518 RepID=UPI002FEFAC86